MRTCMICETPYGILNCINYVSRHKEAGYYYDMYIGDGFQKAGEIVERLRDCGWFEHVWKYRRKTDETSFFEQIDRKFYLRRYLKDVIQDSDYEFQPYDEVYLTSATRFPMCMILACKEAEIFYVDDGFRSYMDDIYVEPLSKLETLVCRLAGKKPRRAFPEVVYLNNVSMCVENAKYKARQLPAFPQKDTSLYEDICRVFKYIPQKRQDESPIIYLAQALEADLKVSGVSKVERSVEKELGNIEEKVIYRPHPRNPVGEKEGLCVDRKGDMWELVCMDGITEDTILISVYSTAMLTPKLLCGKEPWLLFTYPLYRECLSEKWGRLTEDMEFMAQRIRKIYQHPEKVICVEKISDLEYYIGKRNDVCYDERTK